jgi:hypothetical protein
MANSPAYGLSNYALTVPSTTDNLLVFSNTITGNTEFSVDGQGNATVGSNLVLSGTGARIVGDFTNAVYGNRTYFQTSTVNGNTDVMAVPNGTGTLAQVSAWSSNDPANSSLAALRVTAGTDVRLISSLQGTGTFLPMTFYTGGAERMRITSTGNVGIGNATPIASLVVQNSYTAALIGSTGTFGGNSFVGNAGFNVVSPNGGSNSNWYDPANYAGFIFNNVNGTGRYGLLVTNYWRSSENFIFAVDGRYAANGNVNSDTHNPYLIVRGDGIVGIGTNIPYGFSNMDVYNFGSSSLTTLQLRNDNAGTGVAGISFNTTSTQSSETNVPKAGIGLQRAAGQGVGNLIFYNRGTSDTSPYTASDERMRITGSGNVGIGSTTPQQTLDVQGNVNVLNTVIMGSSFLRNRLINGAMKIAQRGTSQNLTTSMAYGSLDRWAAAYATAGTGTFVQSTAGPTGFDYSMQLQRTNGQTSTNALIIAQAIETQNSNDLAGQSITLSFYARAGSTFSATSGALNVYVLAGQGTDQSVASMVAATWTGMTYPINSSVSLTPNGAWIRYSVSGTVPASTTQLGVEFFYYGTGTAGASDWVQITGVQLEPGPVATPFERRLYGQELALCQRYYLLIGDGTLIASGYLTSGSYLDAMVRWPVTMRASPVVAVNGTWNVSGNNGQPTVSLSGASGASLRVTATATGQVYATVSGGSGTPTLSANAEL